jgi:hypothetical protein
MGCVGFGDAVLSVLEVVVFEFADKLAVGKRLLVFVVDLEMVVAGGVMDVLSFLFVAVGMFVFLLIFM